ncbi:DUF4893 domain-containing protein [Sphingomonas montana]|uniref:DUF4893 domain-containing protein n=1 Tax=Sphingomonas montana TaxID=1843236 RepID=UPI00096F3629|nr:DUF4893 domain-containing protein [Sphingomonas montana]
MRQISLSFPILSLLAAACAGGGGRADPPVAPPALQPAGGWRAVISDADRARLRGWRESWVAALARANASGARAKVAAEGALLQPDRALPGVLPPVGLYRCRTTKLGARSPGLLDYVAYPAFSCRIAAGPNGTLSLVKLNGSQRPVGTLYPQDDRRMIFLGTMMLGDERRALEYGRDPERDLVGGIERIGPLRWRLLLPAPRWESLFDVVELVPA